MKSMTGYGWAEEKGESWSASAEIKSYNNRFLDIEVALPPFLSSLEGTVREYLGGRIRRGKVEAVIRYRESALCFSVAVNTEVLKAYWKAAETAARELGINERPSLVTLLEREGVLETEKSRNTEAALEKIMPPLEKALDAFERERKREGAHTLLAVFSYLAALENSLAFIASKKEMMEDHFKKTVRQRFEEMLGNAVDENRVLAETAALLVKYTIAEELSRLEAHLKEFRAAAEQESSPGKKLDFLCQEINREVNTIASKSQELEISGETVRMKDALENIREQLRNVE
ncbi:MAG: YicC family protein [Treponema sp.]|jgi:uncharacterized protein (TIGR00255 family)|nr:YicC family protein [Treponema sp.]